MQLCEVSLDTSRGGDAFLLNDRDHMFLTVDGLMELVALDPSLIPDISETGIKNKTRANNFAKTMACIQGAWFFLQYVVRASQGLPVSLLELNTIGHSLFALLIHCLW
jgi:hypothetical protein